MTKANPEPNGPLAFTKQWLLNNLPQKNELWQGAEYSNNGDEKYPALWLVWVTSPSEDSILNQNCFEEEPVPGLLWDTLVKAMQYPAEGEPRLPTKLLVPPNKRWESLIPHLKEIGITQIATDDFYGVDGVPELIEEVFAEWERKHEEKP